MNSDFLGQFRSVPSQDAVDKALAQANPKELTTRATNILITVGLSQKLRHTLGYQFWYSVVRVNMQEGYQPTRQRGHDKPLATTQEDILKELGGSTSYILNPHALTQFCTKHSDVISPEQKDEWMKKGHFSEEERNTILQSMSSEEEDQMSALLIADLAKVFIKDPGYHAIGKGGKPTPLAIEQFKRLPQEYSGEGKVDYERQEEEDGGGIISPSGLPTLLFEERTLPEGGKTIKHTIVDPTWLQLYYDPTFHTEEGVEQTDEKALAADKNAKIIEVTKILRNSLWLSPLATHAAKSDELINEDLIRGLFQTILSKITHTFANLMPGLRRFALMNDFDLSTTATAIIIPTGIEQVFNSENAAIEFLASRQNQVEPELAAAASIKESPMQKFSKHEIKILVEAANILDGVNPEIASVLDTVLTQKASGDEFTISKADLVASLVRVANQLDEKGEVAAVAEADSLLKLLASQPVE